jgi:hypothetical protein
LENGYGFFHVVLSEEAVLERVREADAGSDGALLPLLSVTCNAWNGLSDVVHQVQQAAGVALVGKVLKVRLDSITDVVQEFFECFERLARASRACSSVIRLRCGRRSLCKLLPHLPALHLLLTSPNVRARRRTRAGTDARSTCRLSAGEVIGYLREHEIALTWDPAAAALQARATMTAKTVTVGTR